MVKTLTVSTEMTRFYDLQNLVIVAKEAEPIAKKSRRDGYEGRLGRYQCHLNFLFSKETLKSSLTNAQHTVSYFEKELFSILVLPS